MRNLNYLTEITQEPRNFRAPAKPRKSGSKPCQCGRTISANKPLCHACAKERKS